MITGIVRSIDDLGRVTIPKEMRDSLNVEIGDKLNIYIKDGVFRMVPVKLVCKRCGSKEEEKLIMSGGITLCTDCIEELATHIEREGKEETDNE
jgi:transcriptional pleiotropic regulator of transition state genes